MVAAAAAATTSSFLLASVGGAPTSDLPLPARPTGDSTPSRMQTRVPVSLYRCRRVRYGVPPPPLPSSARSNMIQGLSAAVNPPGIFDYHPRKSGRVEEFAASKFLPRYRKNDAPA